MKIVNFLFIVLVYFLLGACSKYEVAYDYTPPTSKRGLVCLSVCQTQLKQCNRRCSVQYQQCSIKALQEAKKNLPLLKEAYPFQLEVWLNARSKYERELDWYELQYSMATLRRDRYIDHCVGKGKKRKKCHHIYQHDFHDPYLSLNRPYFNTPRPIKPSLASETLRIKKATCSSNCGCDKNHRLCYASCGGTVTSKKVCVKNCN